jgi:hypothetical protein
MSISAGVERGWIGGGGTFAEQQRLPAVPGAVGTASLNAAVSGQTIPLGQVSTALALATTVVNVMSITLPRNLPIFQCGYVVTTAGTETGQWTGIATQGGIVRCVSANLTGSAATGFVWQSVLPANLIPYVTEYAGLYYFFLGTVASVAVQVGADTALVSAATGAGPPVYCGTAATAATIVPPLVGTSLGALTGTIGGPIYGQTG